jgi:hypothetical protein
MKEVQQKVRSTLEERTTLVRKNINLAEHHKNNEEGRLENL